MKLLQDRIRREGRVLPGNIVKVDGFLNHRVDTALLGQIADEFARVFDTENITLVLTAEASGIALATVCAEKYGVPMIFAKKAKSDNIEGGLYQSEIFSYTYKKKVTLWPRATPYTGLSTSWKRPGLSSWASASPWKRAFSTAATTCGKRVTTSILWLSSTRQSRAASSSGRKRYEKSSDPRLRRAV